MIKTWVKKQKIYPYPSVTLHSISRYFASGSQLPLDADLRPEFSTPALNTLIAVVRPMRGGFFPVLPPTFLHPAESSDTGRPGPCLAILSGRTGFRRPFFGTQNQAYWWIFAVFHPVFAGVVQGYMCIWPASACPNLPTLRSMISRHLRLRKKSRSTRNQLSSMRKRRCRPRKAKSSPNSSRKSAKCWIRASSRSDSEY